MHVCCQCQYFEAPTAVLPCGQVRLQTFDSYCVSQWFCRKCIIPWLWYGRPAAARQHWRRSAVPAAGTPGHAAAGGGLPLSLPGPAALL